MKNAQQVYVLTLQASSRLKIRLWSGTSLHALRHCSVRQLGHALMEMQQQLEALQRAVAAPATGGSYSLNRSR
jgi:hypothetical protein